MAAAPVAEQPAHPGTRTKSHVDASNAAARLRLSSDEVQQLTDLSPEV